MTGRDFRKHRTEIGSEREIAAFVELLIGKTGPLAMNFPAFDIAADNEQRTSVAMIGSTISVLSRHSAEFRHRQNHNVAHSVAQVGDHRRDRLREIVKTCSKLSARRPLIDVRIPSADIRERDLHSDVRLDELRDLQQTLTELLPRILSPIPRQVFLRVRGFKHLHCIEHLSSRSVYEVSGAGAIQSLEPVGL